LYIFLQETEETFMKKILVLLAVSSQAFAGGISSGGDQGLPPAHLRCLSVTKADYDHQRSAFWITMRPTETYSGHVTLQFNDFRKDGDLKIQDEIAAEGSLIYSNTTKGFQLVWTGGEITVEVNLNPQTDNNGKTFYVAKAQTSANFNPPLLNAEFHCRR
jgi:hypothetical protein